MKFTTTASVRRGSRTGARMRWRSLASFLVMCCMCGVVFAGEEWSDSDLTIYGTTSPEATYVKQMNGESLSAANITLGTEQGSASIVAVNNSTISASGTFYLGKEASPGYGNLAATVFLTNSTLSCADLYLGSGVAVNANKPLSIEIGPGGVVNCAKITRYCGRNPIVNFTGGRMIFSGDDHWWNQGRKYRSLVTVEENTWNSKWPNGGPIFRGVGAPIDIEVNKYRELACGWGSRTFKLTGNGGLVKRGSGTLIWEWRTTNSGTFSPSVDYTGDTVVKGGGIVLLNDQDVTKTYATPSASALKLEAGTWFNLYGHPASFLGVSGAGTLKNTVIDTDTPTTPTTLTLGASNGDGEFSPATVIGSFDIVKLGTGTLTIGVSSLDGSLYASNGTVRVASGTSFRCNAIVADGAALDLRGAHVTCNTLTLANCATIIKDENTVIDCSVVVGDDAEWIGGRLSAFGDVSKTGNGTLTLYGPSAKATGSVAIAEGTVVCRPVTSFAGKYYVLRYYGDADKNPSRWESDPYFGVSFSEFSLYGVNGERVNRGAYTYNKLPVASTQTQGGDCGGINDATQLAECEVAVWMPNQNEYFQPNGTSPAAAFDGNLDAGLWNVFYQARWNNIVFRIPDGSPDVVAFTFTTDMVPSRRPTQWSLSGSADGVNWTVLANNATNTDDVAAWTFLTNSTPDTARTEYSLQLLDRLPAGSAAFAPFGNAELSVASGAALDFESAEMEIACLKVDMDAGGGSITRFTPAENGIIDLVSSSQIAVDDEIPLTIGQVSSPMNFRSWTVKVNGVVREDLRIRWRNGRLYVSPIYGMTLIVF